MVHRAKDGRQQHRRDQWQAGEFLDLHQAEQRHLLGSSTPVAVPLAGTKECGDDCALPQPSLASSDCLVQ
jgi:hypothetical protein